jgi:hypothetical protein
MLQAPAAAPESGPQKLKIRGAAKRRKLETKRIFHRRILRNKWKKAIIEAYRKKQFNNLCTHLLFLNDVEVCVLWKFLCAAAGKCTFCVRCRNSKTTPPIQLLGDGASGCWVNLSEPEPRVRVLLEVLV